MKRFAESYLAEWKNRADRKPLILRGARQVGKTYLVEKFAQENYASYLRIDLEKNTDLHALFKTKNPVQILEEVSILYKVDFMKDRSLLFLDEIQACPEAIANLKYFKEECSWLHVIAAGSLLDFVLQDFPYSMPVGRVEFMYLFPLCFEEFLLAFGEERLLNYLKNFHLGQEVSQSLHQQLKECLRKYFFVGGMPEAVGSYLKSDSPLAISRIQNSILTAMENDFSKYTRRVQPDHLRLILNHIPRHLGQKIRYVNLSREVRSASLKQALHWMDASRIIRFVVHSHANGLPLGAEVLEDKFKAIFLDIGLCNQICGLGALSLEKFFTVHEGGVAEQFAGQELLCMGLPFEDQKLFYWERAEKNSNAEIDYLFPLQDKIFPLEIKAGKTGTLKSLHVFLAEKKRNVGIRWNLDHPSHASLKTKVRLSHQDIDLSYQLISLPLYMASQTKRILQECLQ